MQKKLERLTEDLLDISKIETKSLHLKKETFDLKELPSYIVDDYFNQQNISCNIKFDSINKEHLGSIV